MPHTARTASPRCQLPCPAPAGKAFIPRKGTGRHTHAYTHTYMYIFCSKLCVPTCKEKRCTPVCLQAPLAKVKANSPTRDRGVLRGGAPTLPVPAKSAYSAFKRNLKSSKGCCVVSTSDGQRVRESLPQPEAPPEQARLGWLGETRRFPCVFPNILPPPTFSSKKPRKHRFGFTCLTFFSPLHAVSDRFLTAQIDWKPQRK